MTRVAPCRAKSCRASLSGTGVRPAARVRMTVWVTSGRVSSWPRAAALGQELTLPEVTQTVILTRAAGRTPVPEREALHDLARHGATLVIYLSIKLIDAVVAELTPAYGPETPVVVAYRVSWPDQQMIRGTLSTIAGLVQAAGIERQALIMVGPVLSTRDGELKARSKLCLLYTSDAADE